MKLADARVLLTGATGGIGRATADRLAAGGATLVLAGRNERALADRAATLRRTTEAVVDCVVADITTPGGRDALEAAARCMNINVLVNNAGTNRHGRFVDADEAGIDTILATNVASQIHLTRRLLPVLLGQPAARIVNVGSVVGSVVTPGQAVYGASKAAIRAFSDGLRRELGSSPVRVCLVAPRATDTAMNDARVRNLNRRLGIATDPPERVAQAIAASVCDGRPARYIGWPESLFARLNPLVPWLIDRGLRKHARLLDDTHAPADDLALDTGARQ